MWTIGEIILLYVLVWFVDIFIFFEVCILQFLRLVKHLHRSGLLQSWVDVNLSENHQTFVCDMMIDTLWSEFG